MAPNTFLLALLLLLGIRILHAEVRNYDFILKEKKLTRLCSTKSVLVVNGSYPGPTLNVTKGDILYVNVHNQANYPLTIHWHGVKNPRNPWFDGPEYITQCGILPGTNFTYQVILSEEEGTLWWHAHSDWTRWSVHGAIVIHPVEGTTYPFPEPDGDKLIVLGSWYTENVEDLPISDAYAINGELGDFSSCQTGVWLWHCHLDRHLTWGMNSVFLVKGGGTKETSIRDPPAYMPPCSSSSNGDIFASNEKIYIESM